jgi:hypothetical protein
MVGGEGGLSPWSGDFGDQPPQNDLGGNPLNSLNLILMSSRRSDVIQQIRVEEEQRINTHAMIVHNYIFYFFMNLFSGRCLIYPLPPPESRSKPSTNNNRETTTIKTGEFDSHHFAFARIKHNIL